MTLAVQFQHLLAEPVSILPDPVTTQPPARAGAVGAGNLFCAGGGISRHAGCESISTAVSGQNEAKAGTANQPARTPLSWSAVQLSECAYLETICDAIELADSRDEFRVIRAAIAKVRGAINRQSLRMMLELREKEVAL